MELIDGESILKKISKRMRETHERELILKKLL